MIALAAVDLRGGRAVQLVGGMPDTERVRLDDPPGVAGHWVECGFRGLHVIDLDAALGVGSNQAVIDEILRTSAVPVQVGGGLRTEAGIVRVIEAGAARAIVGTRAIEDRAWLERVAGRYPGRIVLAADMREGAVVTHGWTTGTGHEAARFIAGVGSIPLAAVLVTDVSREGRMTGIDHLRFEALAKAAPHPLQAAGGIRDVDDLRALDRAGVRAAILGMSLYTGAIGARAAAMEFNR